MSSYVFGLGIPDPDLVAISARNRRVLGLGQAPQDLGRLARKIEVPEGTEGTLATLEIASNAAAEALTDPLFPIFVREKILQGNGRVPPVEVFDRIFNYLRDNVAFQPDPMFVGDDSPLDYVQTPHWTLFVELRGDCLSLAVAANALSMALGRGAAFKVLRGDRNDPSRFSHAYALLGYKENGREAWIPADLSMIGKPLGYELPNVESLGPIVYPVAPAG